MQPVLALELSSDGILLHKLSYDGVWRKIAAAALNDPFLPKKMNAMRHAARASQGRFFKSQIWLPPEQIKGLEVKLTAQDTEERQAEAEALVRADPAFSDGDYIVQFGEEDVNGNVKIAAINRAVLNEANRFASGYGFGSAGFTSRNRIEGFYEQPYFSISAPPKVEINYAKVGFYGGVTALVFTIAAAGYWTYFNIDFTPDTSAEIEAIEGRVLEIDEDPRAPIRPTDIASNAEHRLPETLSGAEFLNVLPEHDPSVTVFEVLIRQPPLASSVAVTDAPRPNEPLSLINSTSASPVALANIAPDNLPAPETAGFPVIATKNILVLDSSSGSEFSAGQAMIRYNAIDVATTYISSPRLTDVLPNEDSTVVLAAQLRKYNDSLGLTQVRSNNAAQIQLARNNTLQRTLTRIVSGRPQILPVLRGGIEISDVPIIPPAPAMTIAQLQGLAPVVSQGFPPITPTLRDGRNLRDLPDDSPPAPAVTDTTEPAEEIAEPVVQFTTIISGLTTEQLQRIPPRVFEGRPENLPILRSGDVINGGSGIVAGPAEPELTDTERLRPLLRPDSVELTALLASISKQAVPTARAPLHRPAGFAEKVIAIAKAAAELARVTPTFTDERRNVSLPTSANVAATATIENGIYLNETSLIGVFGTQGNYRALLRQRGGKYQTLTVGDTIDGWTIVAISEIEVRMQKSGKIKILKLPAEG